VKSTIYLVLFLWVSLCTPLAVGESRSVSCLGRIEPLGGVVLLAGPSGIAGGSVVISELKVVEGEWVEKDQVLAVLDDYKLKAAEVSRQQALVEDVAVRLKRLQSLSATQSTSRAILDEARYELRALEADQRVHEARLAMSLVRSPLRAQVLKIHSQPGEKVGAEGIMELGETDNMSVIAEVYETDIARVKPGQTVQIRSAALAQPVSGKVSRIGLQVGKMDVLNIDPIANVDARVIEVTVVLDDVAPVAGFTNLQVDVEILL
jgi:multidrug efflux pump subunit AcrA (membrane-fusion protein)